MNKKTDRTIFIVLAILFCIPIIGRLLVAAVPLVVLLAAGIALVMVMLEIFSKDSSNPQRQRQAMQAREKLRRALGRTSKTIGRQSSRAARQAKKYFDENMAEQKKSAAGSARTEFDRMGGSSSADYSQGTQSRTYRSADEPTMHPFYVKALSDLKKDIEVISSRKEKVFALLDDLFGGSTITIDRYRQVIDYSEQTLKKNLKEAEKAISVMDARQIPTPEHKAIIENFVSNSHDIVESFEKVVLELLELQQNRTLDASDHLDENLDELARTTRYYRESGGH